MIIWIIGKSGSGKTYFAKLLKKSLEKKYKRIIHIDGDEVRDTISKDLGYSRIDRKKNSLRIQGLCKLLENQNNLVICSILSIFKEHQRINRRYFQNYYQIYIRSDSKILEQKSLKKVYKLKKNVVGKDIKFVEPYKSDYIIKNDYIKNLNSDVKIIKKIICNIYQK